jgi:hypothetical protein
MSGLNNTVLALSEARGNPVIAPASMARVNNEGISQAAAGGIGHGGIAAAPDSWDALSGLPWCLGQALSWRLNHPDTSAS